MLAGALASVLCGFLASSALHHGTATGPPAVRVVQTVRPVSARLLAATETAAPASSRKCSVRWRPCHYRLLRLKLWHGELEHRGQWYVFGAEGPTTFDCSGLVVYDATQRGIALPRTTYDMIGSYHLVRTYHPRTGDLAFYGTGHVEMFDRPGWTFGAHHSGTRIGFTHYDSYYHPTSYWRVVRRR